MFLGAGQPRHPSQNHAVVVSHTACVHVKNFQKNLGRCGPPHQEGAWLTPLYATPCIYHTIFGRSRSNLLGVEWVSKILGML